MKSLLFKKLSLENFLSIGSTPLVFNFTNGLNLITGYNKDNPTEKNGIGKSSIADGLYFSLFNETIKDLKMSEIVNDKNKKKCKVVIDFSIIENGVTNDYKVTRSIKPSNCKLEVNGEDKSLASIPKTNKLIETILGVSKDLFKQSVIMSIGKSQSFFAQGKIDKRKFIEGIFNLEIFSEMLSDSRSGYNDSKREKETIEGQLTNEKNRLSDYKERDVSFESSKDDVINILLSQIKTDIEKAKKLNASLRDEENPDDLRMTLQDVNTRLGKIDAIYLKNEVQNTRVSSDMTDLKRAIAGCLDYCDKCNRKFEDADNISKIQDDRRSKLLEHEAKHAKIIDNRSVISDKKTLLTTERDGLNLQIGNINSTISNNNIIKSHISTLKDGCRKQKDKVAEKRNETSNFIELIDKSTKAVNNLEIEYQRISKEHKVYDICKFILSEEGVKSRIIKQLKSLLNTTMNGYLEALGSTLTCEFDEYFTETIYNKNGTEKSYDAFSGGEAKRIDLAILLTFQDILKDQSGLDIQLGFYDEILDSSIDEVGRKYVLRILKEKSKNIPIYVISHRGKMSDLIDTEIILEKHNDFTFIKE